MSYSHNRFKMGLNCLRSGVLVLTLGGLLLTGCQRGGEVAEPDQSATVPEPSVDTRPTTEPTAEPPAPVAGAEAPEPDQAPSTAPDTVAAQPNNPPSVQAAALPETLVKTWEPFSEVLYTFGTMRITPNAVEWSSGQSSPYTVVSTDNGYLLKLESAPSFYDMAHPYLRLLPETNESGNVTDVEARFYENEAKATSGEAVMVGGYFVN